MAFIGATADNLPDLLDAHPAGIDSRMVVVVDQTRRWSLFFAKGDRLIAVHAEDQARIKQRRQEFAGITDPSVHSKYRITLQRFGYPTGSRTV